MTIGLDQTAVAAAIWIHDSPTTFLPTFRSLRNSHRDLEINVGGGELAPSTLGEFGLEPSPARTLRQLIEQVSDGWQRHVLVITAPVVVAEGLLDRALPALNDDLRLGTVSFLSNAAGALSVPHRNTPMVHQVGARDEVDINRLLRELAPPPRIAPIPVPVGPIVLLSRYALGACSGLSTDPGSAAFLLSDFGLTASRRGFVSAVDGGTYYSRAFDLDTYRADPIDDQSNDEWGYLATRHPFAVDVHHDAKTSPSSPVALVIQAAAAKIRGLRIIIDGGDIGPKEMGTQVQILSLVRELAARSDVESVQLALPGNVPSYAQPFLGSSKISTLCAPGLDLSTADHADVIHRPSQPSGAIPLDNWQARSHRIVVTLQDLIAYQVGAYNATGPAWLAHRKNLIAGAANADGIIVISDDTLQHVLSEALPLERERIFRVENGTDHLGGNESGSIPAELTARGFLGGEFLLVLGTNYGHKNRDLAIRAWKLLRYSFPQLALVLAGAYVPHGSSRLLEAGAAGDDAELLFALPDVTSEERNWLMRHASAVLYPTSAEGFGLVPFEAARFGTPAIGVRFGPLEEVNPGAPLWAESWKPESLAEATGRVLEDPSLAQQQIRATLSSGETLTWERTARGLVEAYRRVLSMPARWPHRR